jgi:predicted metal-dependent phosphoesterase TrpH
MTNIDLHCHSRLSDGVLAPAELVSRAHANGVDFLALTDHDELGGLAEARARAAELGMGFIDGVEISVTWGGTTVHIVGLQIDPDNRVLQEGLASVRAGRTQRAEKMAAQLSAAGIEGSLEGAQRYAENSAIIGRTHFARYLVESGRAADVKDVFQRFLIKGKPGYVPHQWAELGDAIAWIHAAGGVAVVAHPGRYKLSPDELRQLLTEFRELGGDGIEVITGSHTPAQYEQFATLSREFDLLASRGSDFHGPGESRVELGKLPDLPAYLKPVWHDWELGGTTD